jgi:hypothetical protein
VRGTLGALGVLASCCAISTAPASALEPGVHVDPGSPAAHEYALPLGQARQTGGGSGTSNGSSENGSLFGAGIKPPGGGHGHKGSAGGSRAALKGGAGKGGSPSGATSATGLPPASIVRDARDHSSNGSLLALIGGGVAILVLGGFGGAVLRHRHPPRPTQ